MITCVNVKFCAVLIAILFVSLRRGSSDVVKNILRNDYRLNNICFFRTTHLNVARVFFIFVELENN